MDTTRNHDWHGQLQISGERVPQLYEGSIHQIVLKAMSYLQSANPRLNAEGTKSVTLTFQSQPFDKVATHGLPADFLAALDLSDVPVMTQADTEAMYGSAAPWASDPLWLQFRRLMATQSGYNTAMPGEVQNLQQQLRAKYAGQTHNGVAFDELVADKRKVQ